MNAFLIVCGVIVATVMIYCGIVLFRASRKEKQLRADIEQETPWTKADKAKFRYNNPDSWTAQHFRLEQKYRR